ncbi:hypothetical protein RirG_165060 [Rhizophagus irregularis DAOM 197198w]|uniref:MULE transposase domain-containing protein n=2 Tax=Rhizophagus irregularis TaxID=588596 RepID=A0A015IXR4_RHIIW|nr:hypothetical protein RirG_165060 [Rhizophagus irregularis DAOM 197198w]
MSNQENRTCKGCHVRQSNENFLNDKGVALKKCLHCRDKLKIARLKKKKDESNKENLEIEVSNHVITLISEGDGYSWVYRNKNQKKDSLHILYYCNCRIELGKWQVKHPILDKQRDTSTYLEQYHCEGTINIEILSKLDLIKVKYSHKMLHPRLRHVNTTYEIKRFIQDNLNCPVSEIWRQIRENQIIGHENITVQQTYYWWSIQSPIEIDATYGTNNLAWELYAIMGVIDGTGFPLSYLIISVGKNRNITGILTQWMQALKERNLRNFPFILTDKDFSEINAAQTVWPEARLQLCVWHLRRAIKQRLSSNKIGTYYSYNPKVAHEECSSIDPSWGIINNSNLVFCPLKLRKTVISIVENHSNRHMLLLKHDGTFITNADEIWKECVKEMIEFCKENELLQLWVYLWREWYSKEKWNLWARAANKNISHIKTTMIVTLATY